MTAALATALALGRGTDILDALSSAVENADPVPPLIGGGVGAVLLLLGFRLRGEDGRAFAGLLMAGLAAFASLLAALYASDLTWSVPPKAFRDWTLLAAAAGVPIALLFGAGPVLRAVGVWLSAMILVYLFSVPTESLHERYWDGQVFLYVAGLAGAGVLALLVPLGQGARGRTAEGMLAFAISASMAAPAVGLTGSAASAGLAGALAVGTGVFGLLLALRPAWESEAKALSRAAAAVQVISLVGVIATGVLYAETPKWSGAVILLAPALTLLPGRGRALAILRLLLVAAAAAAPVIVALLEQEAPNPYGGY